MGVKVVVYQDDFLGVRILLIQKPLDFMRPFQAGALGKGLAVSPSGERFCEKEYRAGSDPAGCTTFSLGEAYVSFF